LETSDIHILALSRDECAVREALKMVKYQKRLKLKAVDASERKSQDATAGSSNACSDPPDWTTYVEDDNVDIVVKRTFLECRPKVEALEGPELDELVFETFLPQLYSQLLLGELPAPPFYVLITAQLP